MARLAVLASDKVLLPDARAGFCYHAREEGRRTSGFRGAVTSAVALAKRNGRHGRRRWRVEVKEIVSQDPEVVSGELVFAGTRVPVKNLVDYLKGGDTLDEFLEGFPGVSREQAEAYLQLTMEVAGEKLVAGPAR